MKNKNMSFKFVIMAPRQKWGGAIVLHVLCKCLMDLGYNAKIVYYGNCKCNPGLLERIKFLAKYMKYTLKDILFCMAARVSRGDSAKYNGYKYKTIKGCRRKLLPFVDKKTIVIYGDNIYGNPLGASKVVRYLLYYFQYENDKYAYSKEDVFIAYRDEFNNEKLNTDNFIMTIPYFDLDFYKQTNFGSRKGNCYIIRKGTNRPDLPSEFDGPIIDDLSEPQKVRIFNECEYCISYDVETAYSALAALCGCKSILVPELGKTIKDYRDEEPRYGVAIGDSEEEIEYAINTIDRLRIQYTQFNVDSRNKVERFAELCKKKYSNMEV